MPNKVKVKRTYTAGVTPTASELQPHEFAVNWADGVVYVKAADGTIQSVTLGGSSGGGSDSRWDLFLPAAPTSLTATGGNAQASLSWTAPTVLAQTPITDYTVQFSSNSGSTWTTFTRAASTATSVIVTGLTNGTAYVFRVAAVNGVGTGSYSSASSSVTPVAPSVITIGTQPSNQTAASGAATFSVSASVTQSATLSYQWQRSTNSGSTFAAISGATSSSLALTGLVSGDNGYQYRVLVSATGGATSVTSSAATLTVAASGPLFTSQRQYNGVTENIDLTGLNTSQVSFVKSPSAGVVGVFHNASSNYSLTITSQTTAYCAIRSPIEFPGSSYREDDGDYELNRQYTANTPFTINNVPSGVSPVEITTGNLGAGQRITLALS